VVPELVEGLVEMTSYTVYGGFDPSTELRDRRLNHRKNLFLDSYKRPDIEGYTVRGNPESV
jgi:hypothetical protein